jgi:thiol-disulfide isomerase/thioredoxin
MIEITSTQNFKEICSDSQKFSFILFGGPNCSLCDDMKKNMVMLEPIFQKFIGFYYLDISVVNDPELLNQNNIGYMPRSLIFKDSKEVGRILLYKPFQYLVKRLNTLIKNGKILTEADDGEEAARFTGRIIQAIGLDWDKIPDEQWDSKAKEVMEISDKLIKENEDWSILPIAKIKELIC